MIKNLEGNHVKVMDNIKKAASLSVYAVRTRYPGEEEPVTKKEFKEALDLAEIVFKWVKSKLKGTSQPEPQGETGEAPGESGNQIQR